MISVYKPESGFIFGLLHVCTKGKNISKKSVIFSANGNDERRPAAAV